MEIRCIICVAEVGVVDINEVPCMTLFILPLHRFCPPGQSKISLGIGKRMSGIQMICDIYHFIWVSEDRSGSAVVLRRGALNYVTIPAYLK
jgi:hypothetical protein